MYYYPALRSRKLRLGAIQTQVNGSMGEIQCSDSSHRLSATVHEALRWSWVPLTAQTMWYHLGHNTYLSSLG